MVAAAASEVEESRYNIFWVGGGAVSLHHGEGCFLPLRREGTQVRWQRGGIVVTGMGLGGLGGGGGGGGGRGLSFHGEKVLSVWAGNDGEEVGEGGGGFPPGQFALGVRVRSTAVG